MAALRTVWRGVVGACLAGSLCVAPALAGPVLQLRATPMLSEVVPSAQQPPTFVSGREIRGRPDLETTISGDAQLRRPGLSVHADTIGYEYGTDTATFRGKVRVNSKGDRYTAELGQLRMDASEGFLLRPSYHFLETGGHGEARNMRFMDASRVRLEDGDYTTCERPGPDWVPDWILRAAQLDVDQEEQSAVAKKAVLEFKGVPIVAVPHLDFPLSGQRRSGLLPPTVGLDSRSGFQVSQPYYWNIAPNRDATVTPTAMARRGLNLGGQFRYLEDNYEGRVEANVLPDDRLLRRTRWSLSSRHSGNYDTGISAIGQIDLALNVNRVSDNDYWRDFNDHTVDFTDRLLSSDMLLSWGRGNLAAFARVQKWQTLQDPEAPILPPYDRLPELNARWQQHDHRGLDYSLRANYTRFHGRAAMLRQPNGQRGLLDARMARPLVRPWGRLTPGLQLHATQYAFDGAIANGSRSATRVLPTATLDGELVFERPAQYFGRAFTQTLEPRLKYIYTPYRRQADLPNYDSALYDFNFASIWADNAFAGGDRISNDNMVTAGLTSRLLDPDSGVEALRLAVAQRYRFSPQRVTLGGETPEGKGWSDLMLGASIDWDPRWSVSAVTQYSLDRHRSSRTTVAGHWRPGPYRVLSAAYRLSRNQQSEQLELAWQWPLSELWRGREELGSSRRTGGAGCRGKWYGAGRLNYSLHESKVVDAVAGFEYDAGCWVGRVVLEKIGTGVSTSTKRVMFQLELVGLSRIGTGASRALDESVPYYQPIRRESTQPSRFSTYE